MTTFFATHISREWVCKEEAAAATCLNGLFKRRVPVWRLRKFSALLTTFLSSVLLIAPSSILKCIYLAMFEETWYVLWKWVFSIWRSTLQKSLFQSWFYCILQWKISYKHLIIWKTCNKVSSLTPNFERMRLFSWISQEIKYRKLHQPWIRFLSIIFWVSFHRRSISTINDYNNCFEDRYFI